jgi:hypothetical protein
MTSVRAVTEWGLARVRLNLHIYVESHLVEDIKANRSKVNNTTKGLVQLPTD